MEIDVDHIFAHLDERSQKRVILFASDKGDLGGMYELEEILLLLFNIRLKFQLRVFDSVAHVVVRTVVFLCEVDLVLLDDGVHNHRGFKRIERLALNRQRVGVFKIALVAAYFNGQHSLNGVDRAIFVLFNPIGIRINRAHHFALIVVRHYVAPRVRKNLVRLNDDRVGLDLFAAEVVRRNAGAAFNAAQYGRGVRRRNKQACVRRISFRLVDEKVSRNSSRSDRHKDDDPRLSFQNIDKVKEV